MSKEVKDIFAKYQGMGMFHDFMREIKKVIEGKKKPWKFPYWRSNGGYNQAIEDIANLFEEGE